MLVLSPWTQRRLQRAFMMRKVDRTGRLGEFNPLPMVTALLGLDGDEDDDEDEAVASAGEKKQESKTGESTIVLGRLGGAGGGASTAFLCIRVHLKSAGGGWF